MRQLKPIRVAAVTIALLAIAASTFAQLLSPAVRGKAMDAIDAKYAALAKLPIAERRQQTVAFAKSLPEIRLAQVTKDGNVACLFKDNVPYMILGNVAVDPPKEPNKLARRDGGPFAPQAPRFTSFPLVGSSFEPSAPFRDVSATLVDLIRSSGSMQIPTNFEANDLPASLEARTSNALGKVFGNSCAEIKKMLTSKGYSVSPTTDASILTLMGIRDLGVFYLQCHGGMSTIYDQSTQKVSEEYTISSSEAWSPIAEEQMRQTPVGNTPNVNLINGGYLALGSAVWDRDANGKEIVKRFFWITKKFIKTFWRFSKNSFVLIYGCTTFHMGDALKDASVNASVYCGTSDLGDNESCQRWIKMFFDRMTGTNDAANGPDEDYVAQRPFDWLKLYPDFEQKKRLWPKKFKYEGQDRVVFPVFFGNRDHFGVLTPSIKVIRPKAYEPKIEIEGIFGEDPGEPNRKVTIANVGQVVDKWEPDKITVILADTPLGTSGEVIVYNRNRPSNSRWLSKWTGTVGITIAGEQSLAFNADFNVNMVGDPNTIRENPGIKPTEQFIWSLYTTYGSTCTWKASGDEKDSDGKVIRKWTGDGTPSCWLDMSMLRKNTFGVGGVADSFIRKVNLYLAIMSNFTLTEHGTDNPKTPIKLGDWLQGQTLVQVPYDTDYNILGGQKEIDDEPSKLSYGGKSAVLIWSPMQCRYGMPKIAAR